LFEKGDRRCSPILQLDQLRAEIDILLGFIAEADAIGLRIPEDSMGFREKLYRNIARLLTGCDQSDAVIWPPRHVFAALALARHSGLPTRLLDWTSSSLKAAYFAASEAAAEVTLRESPPDSSTRICVWEMDQSRFVLINDLARNIGSRFDSGEIVPVEIFSVPRAANPNAHAQSGWFSVVREEFNQAGPIDRLPLDFAIAKAIDGIETPVFLKYTLPHNQVRRLMWLLAVHNIKATSVYPDYRGAALAACESRLYDRPAE
jgi:hypothetical protein